MSAPRPAHILALWFLIASSVRAAAQELVGIDYLSQVAYRVDLGLLSATPIAPVTGAPAEVGSLAVGPDGSYYGMTTGAQPVLMRIDPGDFSGQVVGSSGLSFAFEGGLAISPTGQAFGVNAGSSAAAELFSVDLTTGAATVIGVMGAHDFNAVAWRSDGMLLGADRVTASLYTIDPATAQTNLLTTLPLAPGSLGGMTIVGGTAYASLTGSLELLAIDPFSGLATNLGAVVGVPPTLGFGGLAESLDSTAVVFCAGDGSGSVCPCANEGLSPGSGCMHSGGLGAGLSMSGSSQVAQDALVAHGTDLVPGQPALLFAGLNAVNGGAGVFFGDGLRCVGGGVVRLGVAAADGAGSASWGPGLAAATGVLAGETRHFQVWYRDPLGSPCGSAFNLSSAVTVLFQ